MSTRIASIQAMEILDSRGTPTFQALKAILHEKGLSTAVGGEGGFAPKLSSNDEAFMTDFAVAMGGGQIKTGSMCRSERIAKYNRLPEIEADLGARAAFGR